MVFSEFGAAALYGNHTFDDIRWTEEYQAKLISYCLKLFHEDPMVVGFISGISQMPALARRLVLTGQEVLTTRAY